MVLGGEREGVGEDQRPHAVLLTVVVYELQELELFWIVGGIGGGGPLPGDQDRHQECDQRNDDPPVTGHSTVQLPLRPHRHARNYDAGRALAPYLKWMSLF